MFWFKKDDQHDKTDHPHDKRERLFFHDIINLTHGLILFFNQRQNSNKGISADEVAMLEKEVRTLQSVIKDHYNFKHKNILNTYDWVPFNVGLIAVKSLLQNYFPSEMVKTSITCEYSNYLANEKSETIYFPVFYRIMNNLIKNMAEANTQVIEIHFKFTTAGLSIETKNLNKTDLDLEMISDNLSRLILNEADNGGPHGLGLESIHYLALECGGKFEFEIVDNFWINKVLLPGPVSIEQKKAA